MNHPDRELYPIGHYIRIQGVWLLSQVNQRLGLAFLQQLPSGRRPDGVLPWAWRKNSSLPLKAWCLKQFSWACFTLK